MLQAPAKVLFPFCGQLNRLDLGNRGRGRRASNIFQISRLVTHPFIRPNNSSHQADADADDLPCPGLAGKSNAANKRQLKKLLTTAEEDGEEARTPGHAFVKKNGRASKCTKCEKTGRRDRVLDHVLYRHLNVKSWSCPLWCVNFHWWDLHLT
jgi:hypothetical protein